VNGTPLPALFDLERVEVLRGPQGTLFGGGSEGGTIRYIQPQPGLRDYSDYVRTQVSTTRHGGVGYEAGAAFGGPILRDKLGFRASVYARRGAGYIDLVDPFTGRVWNKDANTSTLRSVRVAAAWAPTDRIRATLSYVSTFSRDDHALDRMTIPIADPIVVPRLCYDTRGIEAMPITSTARTTPAPIGRGEAECAAARATGRTTHETPGYTLGPYPLKPYRSVENDVWRAKASFRVYSLDLDYDADRFTAKSITSYSEDSPKQSFPQPFQVNRVTLAADATPNDLRNARAGSQVIPSGIPFIPFLGPEGFKGPAHFTSRNPRYSFTQEFRLASEPDARPFTWVAGIFYSNIRIKPDITLISDSNDYSLAQFGITDVQRYGIRSLQSAPGVFNVFARVRERLRDVELAGFGEVNYWVSDRLKLIAGLRLSRIHFDYTHAEIGPSIGVDVATFANGGAFEGAVDESPATPRVGAQYFFKPDSSVYVTAAKGYRAGGVNTPVAQAQAGDSLARNFGAGFTVFNLPRAYASDSVWSYEAGVKARLFRRVQLNGAVYAIDWKNPQVSTLIPQSGATVTTNGVAARSRGFELEAQAALPAGFSTVGTLGYTRASYTKRSVAFVGFNGVEAVATLAGQRIPTPPVTASFGLRRDFRIGRPSAYLRADWRYSGGFDAAPFGATTWNPDSNHFPSHSETNLRAGLVLGSTELNVFVNNLFEPHSGQVSGGRTGCALPAAGGTPACTAYSAYEIFRYTSWGRPREIGVQLIHRH
jgi:iron complex outermembrane recepter protein